VSKTWRRGRPTAPDNSSRATSSQDSGSYILLNKGIGSPYEHSKKGVAGHEFRIVDLRWKGERHGEKKSYVKMWVNPEIRVEVKQKETILGRPDGKTLRTTPLGKAA